MGGKKSEGERKSGKNGPYATPFNVKLHSITADSTPAAVTFMEFSRGRKLPVEFLSEILSRLDVKVLCRCKCVSKKWCSLIESPNFVKQHFDQETNPERLLVRFRDGEPDENCTEKVVHHEPIAEPHEEQGFFHFISEEEYLRLEAMEDRRPYKCALYADEAFSKYELPSHLQMPGGVEDLIGPLDGVFLAVTRVDRVLGPMALLNPALRQFKPLPLIPQFPVFEGYCDSEFGFGLDPDTGDHKLVMLLYFVNRKTKLMHCAAYVCNSDSDDSWRQLEGLDPIMSTLRVHKTFGVTFLNGVYYWLLECGETNANLEMLAFDMATDKFRQLPLLGPAAADTMWEYLSVCGESLALLEYDEKERCIDVWMMVNEACWIKKSRVGPLEGFRWPLCFWRNDELLFEILPGFLTLCNISTHESRIVRVQKADMCDLLHWVFVYKESLVSIKGKAGKCKLWDPSSDLIKNFFQVPSSESSDSDC